MGAFSPPSWIGTLQRLTNSLKITTLFYKKLNVDPTAKHSEIVNSTIESFRKQELISNSTASKFGLDKVRTPQFHISPEAHKLSVPGRLLVSSIECHASKISKFVENSLQPHAKSLFIYKRYLRLHQQNQWNKRYKWRHDSRNVRCQITLYQYSKSWRDRSSENPIKLHISKADCYKNYYQVVVLNTNTQQFCIQWNSLSAKICMCHGNNMCTKLR